MMTPLHIENRSSIQGFTLIELLFVLAISALLLAIAAPGFQTMSAQSKAKNSLHKLSGVLRLARNHAVNYQTPVLVCPSEDGSHCLDQDWQHGLMILADRNSNRQADPSETVVYFRTPFLEQGRLHWNALKNSLSFSTSGLPSGSVGSFVYCPGNNDVRYAHALVISFSGKMRFAEDQNQDGIREAGNNRNIACPG